MVGVVRIPYISVTFSWGAECDVSGYEKQSWVSMSSYLGSETRSVQDTESLYISFYTFLKDIFWVDFLFRQPPGLS